jgi:excisionase family DNA binding protein
MTGLVLQLVHNDNDAPVPTPVTPAAQTVTAVAEQHVHTREPASRPPRQRGHRLSDQSRPRTKLTEAERKAKRVLAQQRRKERIAQIDTANLPDVIDVDEVAALLRVDDKTVREMFARGEIPGRRVGRKLIRFNREAVLGWLAQGCASRSSRRTA